MTSTANLRDYGHDFPAAIQEPVHSAGNDDLSYLRIAFVSGNYNCLRDGANRAQNLLVRYLLDRGAAVRVYSPTCDEPAFAPTGDLVSVPSAPLPFGRKEYRIAWRLPRAIREDIAEFSPNLFHISLPLFHGRSALRLARRMGVPAVAAMHTRFETYPRYYGLAVFEKPLIAALRRFYSGCDHVVAPCEPVAQTMRSQGMGENIGIWSRGVDTEVFHPRRRDDDFRRTNGFRPDTPVIAFLGRLVLEKGLADFAQTVARLRSQGAVFHTLVIGDGPARAEFERMLGEASFIGFREGAALAQALASADLLLNPSSTEAFSNVSLEAMACGVPVIAADAIGNSNLVVDGETGVLVAPGDIEGYARAALRYLADPALRAAHAVSAQARAAEFSWDSANEKMAELYRSVLTAHRARAVPEASRSKAIVSSS